MARIIALLPGAVASVDLDHFACRLDLGATQVGPAPALALVYRFPPSPAAMLTSGGIVSMAPFAQVALVRAPLDMAGADSASVQRVADVALAGGSLDADIARLTEAYRMFNNIQGVRAKQVDEATADGVQVVRAYWFVRDWVAAGATNRVEGDFLGTRLICQ